MICRVMGNFIILSAKKVIKSKKTRWVGHVTSVGEVAYGTGLGLKLYVKKGLLCDRDLQTVWVKRKLVRI